MPSIFVGFIACVVWCVVFNRSAWQLAIVFVVCTAISLSAQRGTLTDAPTFNISSR